MRERQRQQRRDAPAVSAPARPSNREGVKCPHCGRLCKSKSGLWLHKRVHIELSEAKGEEGKDCP